MVDKERMSAIASTVAISLRMERDRASCGMVEKVVRYAIAITVARSFRMV